MDDLPKWSIYRHVRESKRVRFLVAPVLALRRARQRARARPIWEITERISRILVEDPVVRLVDFKGDFQINSRSHLFAQCVFTGSYEPEMAKLCAKYLDTQRDAVDVGANVGFFTVFFARELPYRRVLSIEPLPGPQRRLRANVERNGVGDQVIIFEGAVSDRPERIQMTYVEGREEYATMGKLVHPAVVQQLSQGTTDIATIEVTALTLDQLVERHSLRPGIIKIDVEGAESRILQGALQTLKDCRPILLLEAEDRLLAANGSSVNRLSEILRSANYGIIPVDERPNQIVALPLGQS